MTPMPLPDPTIVAGLERLARTELSLRARLGHVLLGLVAAAMTIAEAEATVASWLSQPAVGILEPGDRHWDILRSLVREGQTAGRLVMDAVLAAIAIEHGATLYTSDRDFSRFPDLKWKNPLIQD